MLAAVLWLTIAYCLSPAGETEYFGNTKPPEQQSLRYVTGSEPETLDPQIGTGQPEARLYMALFEGLAEYHPVTMEAIPAIAERWESNADSSGFVFHLRKNARWSDGAPVTAQDFVYTFRRGLSPELASRNAYLAYYVKYGQGYNEGGVFVRDAQTGQYVLESDVRADRAGVETPPRAASAAPDGAVALVAPSLVSSEPATREAGAAEPETPFRRLMRSPARLILPGDEKARAKEIEKNTKLKETIEGKEFVPVRAEDIGVEAVDDHTLRVTLSQPAPFFINMIPHHFFRAVPRRSIERYREEWTQPGKIITSGPFKLQTWEPYHEIVVVRDPLYWDAAQVRLAQIAFYPSEELTTMMNLYKAGEVDALANHSVPAAWLDAIRPLKDYMDAPEMAIQYYLINVTKPPMNDRRVRKAFNMAIDKQALSAWRRVTKPLTAFTPEGIFPGYPQPQGDAFNPPRAQQLLAEAGYRDQAGNFDPATFPVDQVELSYNTLESNRQIAEFIQAQWKQHLRITVPLRNMEFRTFLAARAKLEYRGFSRSGFAGDYIDPFTFLNLFSTPGSDNGTGWWDPKYVAMLDEANHTLDQQKRYELLARAEAFLLDEQPVIPLYTNATNWVKKPYVKGLYPNPGTLHAWKFVYIEHDAAKWSPEDLPRSARRE